MSTPIRLAVLVASTREGRFGPVVARWFAGQAAARDDVELTVVDLIDHPVPGAELAAAIGAADAIVVVTPEYNHSFPGPLKTAIDSVRDEWAATPIGFVSYGGISGGLRAVEGLRPVFAELHAMTIRETVVFPLYWESFDADGALKDPAPATAAADALLEQLIWWAHALRNAHAERPYGAVRS